MQALGFHYLIELHGCAREKLGNEPFLEDLFQKAVKESGATEIGRIFHKKLDRHRQVHAHGGHRIGCPGKSQGRQLPLL